MIPRLKKLLLLTLCACSFHTACATETLEATDPQDDTVFYQLKMAAQKQDADKAKDLAAYLSKYPVQSYVEYYRLRANLSSTSQSDVEAFLAKYPNTAIADRLKNDWLLVLGKNQNWSEFDKYFPLFALQDDNQVQCYHLISRAEKGENVVDDAKRALNNPRKYGEACLTLTKRLYEKSQFSKNDIWFFARSAYTRNYPNTAIRIATMTGIDRTELSKSLDNSPTIPTNTNEESKEVYLLSLTKLAKKDANLAAQSLESNIDTLNRAQQQAGWATIALSLAMNLEPTALDYWKKAGDTPLSELGYEWRVRSALRANDWDLVYKWILAMPEYLRKQDTWLYWRARALQETGHSWRAEKYYEAVANKFGFYAILAQEALKEPIKIGTNRSPISQSEVDAIKNLPGMQLAAKFFAMNWRFEAVREWNWQLRSMEDRQLLAAAEYAKQLGYLDRMINTSNRTQKEHDFNQRYPMPYRDIITQATSNINLDMALAYGIMRQESRFVTQAKSSVGASGLMQLMPSTAKLVAKRIGLSDYQGGKLNGIETNIILGTNYLKSVLDNFDGSEPLATAGYNAGPGRPRKWRSTLTNPVDGAVFAETIPFNETRNYVKYVLANATYYAILIGKGQRSLTARLGVINTQTPIKPYNDSENTYIEY